MIATEAKKLEMENEARKKLEEQRRKTVEHIKLDLMSYRTSQGIAYSYTFSYFQYVSPQKDTSSSASKKAADTSSSKKVAKTRKEKK